MSVTASSVGTDACVLVAAGHSRRVFAISGTRHRKTPQIFFPLHCLARKSVLSRNVSLTSSSTIQSSSCEWTVNHEEQ